jgi:hypothetical protein
MISEYEKRLIIEHGHDACSRHVLSHSAGVLNSALPAKAIAPDTGQPVTCDTPASGSPMRWGSHHFILSASHVFDDAKPDDLRVATYSSLPTEYLAAEAVTAHDLTAGLLLGEDSCIHRCTWEDLAIVTVDPSNYSGVDFTDLNASCSDPAQGEDVASCGFPSDHYIPVKTPAFPGSQEKIELAIYPTFFGGAVSPFPSADEVKFYYGGDLDPQRHYLVPYELPGVSDDPHGVSGSAVWRENSEKHIVWRPCFKFAGTITHYHRKKRRLRVVKASTVRRFVAEVFGEP